MPTRPPRRCPKKECNHLNPCPVHLTGWRRCQTPPLPSNWDKLRRIVRKMANGHCKKCGIQCWDTGKCDHIINRMRGGTDDLSNLQWLCPKDHDRKTHIEAKIGYRRKHDV